MNQDVKKYLSAIGRKGGKASRRRLEPDTARLMVRVREARRAYRQYHIRCFWSFDPDYVIGARDIPWVAEQLMKHGDRNAWALGMKLCH